MSDTRLGTGGRLPAYVFRDNADIQQSLDANAEQMAEDPDLIPSVFASKHAVFDAINAFKRGDYEQLSEKQTRMLIKNQNAMTEEQPLAVPTCFKNGTPYLDCDWKFGLKDGKELSPAETKRIRELGIAIDRQMKEAIASGQPLGFEGACSTADRSEYLPRCGKISSLDNGMYEGQPEEIRVPQPMLNEYRDLTWYDVSPDLPRGYGYALSAWPAYSDNVWSLSADVRGPAVSVASLRTAFDPAKKTTHSQLIRVKAALRSLSNS